jgi:hypothetical protein
MSAAKKSNAALLRPSTSSKALAMPATDPAGADAQRPPKAPPPRKAANAAECQRLEQLPNIGPSLAADLRDVGINHPQDLPSRDAFELYTRLCTLRGKRQDPCVLDTFMAAVDFMRGAAPQHWWAYTAERKRLYSAV